MRIYYIADQESLCVVLDANVRKQAGRPRDLPTALYSGSGHCVVSESLLPFKKSLDQRHPADSISGCGATLAARIQCRAAHEIGLEMSFQETIVDYVGRHTVILCHPDPHSFNHSVAKVYCDAVDAAGQTVVARDLYAIGFDSVLKADERPAIASPTRFPDVTAELEAIKGSDVFVLVYPIWFGSPLAMMKGYIERVLGAGVRPEDIRKKVRTDLLGGKRLLSFMTSATTDIWLNEQGQEQGLQTILDIIWRTHLVGIRRNISVSITLCRTSAGASQISIFWRS